MNDLAIYLNDHLAGSVAALEMLDAVIETHKGEPIEQFLVQLRQDIEVDRGELKRLMQHLGVEESTLRKAGAWVAEKFSRGKLRAGDSGKANLALLQSLESLSLGITGKRSLWRTLGDIAQKTPSLGGFDFARLEQRATEQFERAQAQSLELAREIFPAELEESARK